MKRLIIDTKDFNHIRSANFWSFGILGILGILVEIILIREEIIKNERE
jgi:hypothetical protein